MKRDWNLIRCLLLEINRTPEDETFDLSRCAISGVDEATLKGQLALLIDSSFVQSSPCNDHCKLTHEGREFVELARPLSIWNAVMQRIKAIGIGATQEIVTKLLRRESWSLLNQAESNQKWVGSNMHCISESDWPKFCKLMRDYQDGPLRQMIDRADLEQFEGEEVHFECSDLTKEPVTIREIDPLEIAHRLRRQLSRDGRRFIQSLPRECYLTGIGRIATCLGQLDEILREAEDWITEEQSRDHRQAKKNSA